MNLKKTSVEGNAVLFIHAGSGCRSNQPDFTGTATFQALDSKHMCGYLTGFIDLICEYNELYYVMDYKITGLPNYTPENLTRAMREHNYGLQYWIYTVVLHRYLQQRLPGYTMKAILAAFAICLCAVCSRMSL